MPTSLITINNIALMLYTVYLAGILGGVWTFWRASGKQRIWGLIILIESVLSASLLTIMSTKYWSKGGIGIIGIDIGPLVWTLADVFVPLILGIIIVITAAYPVMRLTKSRYWVAGRILSCFLIPLVFSASVPQLISLTQREKPPQPEPEHDIKIDPNFKITIFKKEPANNPTSIVFGPDNNIYIANYNGDIWGISTKDGTSWRYATGFNVPVGLAWYDNLLYVASLGKVSIVYDKNGDHIGDEVKDIITGLPARLYPWHANNGIVFGPDNRIYFAVGSSTDRSPETYKYAASILSAKPDGSDLRVFATGFRNPYRLAFNSKGDLFATDNGPDGLDVTPDDELNRIVEGGDYGFPKEFGIPNPGSAVQAPVALFPPHSSSDGLVFYQGHQFPSEYYDNAFVTLWHLGQIYRVQFSQDTKGNYLTRLSLFAIGLHGPVDLAVGPDGNLYEVDFGSSIVYKISYVGSS